MVGHYNPSACFAIFEKPEVLVSVKLVVGAAKKENCKRLDETDNFLTIILGLAVYILHDCMPLLEILSAFSLKKAGPSM